MTFLIRAGAPFCRARLEARALTTWRNAEQLVCERWSAWLVADREARPGAFAAYLFALEAEAAAAGGLARDTEAAAAGEIAVPHLDEAV